MFKVKIETPEQVNVLFPKWILNATPILTLLLINFFIIYLHAIKLTGSYFSISTSKFC